jgi:membrane-associated phospholipid phosphatase
MATEASFPHPHADPQPSQAPFGLPGVESADTSAAMRRSYGTLVAVIFVAYTLVGIGLYVWRDVEFTPRVWAGLILVGVILLGQWTAPLAARLPQGRLLALMFLGFMLVGGGLSMWRGVWFTPDRWAVFLFVGAVVLGQGLAFLRDWVPVVLLIFGYEFMRGIAYEMVREQGRGVHLGELIDADRALFGGQVPTLWLQDRLYTPGTVHWYDVLSALMYALHFVFPLVFAFVLWLGRKERFWQFSLTFLLMTYVAFAFFLFYPAAPPWLANQQGAIQGLEWPLGQTYQFLVPERYDNFDTYQIWNKASGNPVAAMPSLHAGFPWLTLLFAVKFFGRRGLPFVVYNLALWFSVVYLGHHWVVDILGGIAWATVCFVVVLFAWPWVMRGFDIPVPRPIRRLAEQRRKFSFQR